MMMVILMILMMVILMILMIWRRRRRRKGLIIICCRWAPQTDNSMVTGITACDKGSVVCRPVATPNT